MDFAPDYIGDGVYVQIERDMLALRTGRHDNPDAIYLEAEVWGALLRYVVRAGWPAMSRLLNRSTTADLEKQLDRLDKMLATAQPEDLPAINSTYQQIIEELARRDMEAQR